MSEGKPVRSKSDIRFAAVIFLFAVIIVMAIWAGVTIWKNRSEVELLPRTTAQREMSDAFHWNVDGLDVSVKWNFIQTQLTTTNEDGIEEVRCILRGVIDNESGRTVKINRFFFILQTGSGINIYTMKGEDLNITVPPYESDEEYDFHIDDNIPVMLLKDVSATTALMNYSVVDTPTDEDVE